MSDHKSQASNFVKRKIMGFVSSKSESAVKATLANLRRGIGKKPGALLDLWETTLKDLPPALCGKGPDETTKGEWATYTALTLYALHQQGKDPKRQCISKDGVGLGAAVRGLVHSDEDEERIKRRFNAAATADSPLEFAHHLRGLVQLLRADDLVLDYPALAGDLYQFQSADEKDAVRLRWGRDFYRIRGQAQGDAGQGNTEEDAE